MPIPAGPTGAATFATWVDRTRAHLMSGRQEARNALGAAYSAGAGVLTLAHDLGAIVPGVRLSVGLNTFYVVSVSGMTATVLGGQEGSTDAGAAINTLVRVAPRFTDFEIAEALLGDLADLSAPENGLFQVSSLDLTSTLGVGGYDLSGLLSDPIDIYSVRAQTSGTSLDWIEVPRIDYRLDRDAPTTVFPSGYALQLYRAQAATGLTLRVLYRRAFDLPALPLDPADLATDLATTGLPATAWDLPPMGAAIRLALTREIKRNFTESQGDTRRAGEVQAGASAASMRPLAALRASRIMAESGRLTSAYPDRRR